MTDFLAFLTQIDIRLFYTFNQLRSPFLDFIMIRASDFGIFSPLIGAFILFRLYKGGKKERIFWIIGIITIVLSDAICARILKPLFARPRPYLTLDNIYVYKGAKWIITNPEIRKHFHMSFSWPSCHATNIWAATIYIWQYRLKYGLIMVPLAILVSYSRIYLGVHYPFDCLGGLAVGAIVALIFSHIAKRLYSYLKN